MLRIVNMMKKKKAEYLKEKKRIEQNKKRIPMTDKQFR